MELTPEESQHIRDLVEKAFVSGDGWLMEHALALFADTLLPESWKEEEKDVDIADRVVLDKD